MDSVYIELSKRLLQSKWFKWMPGMATYTTMSYIPSFCGRIIYDESDINHLWISETIPDLRDPATLGCLLYLVRKAWDMPTGIIVKYSNDDGLWCVSWSGATHGGWCGRGKTEAEALIVALENA
jgi:hypothetical protein